MNIPYYWDTEQFLIDAKANAAKNGYNPNLLFLATDGTHKLAYLKPDGKIVKFGARGYGDILFYRRFLPAKAAIKRNIYRKSHGAMRDSGKYSANQLSINVLWD